MVDLFLRGSILCLLICLSRHVNYSDLEVGCEFAGYYCEKQAYQETRSIDDIRGEVFPVAILFSLYVAFMLAGLKLFHTLAEDSTIERKTS